MHIVEDTLFIFLFLQKNALKFSDAVHKMNVLGKESVPFLFIINYDKSQAFVYAQSEIPDTVFFRVGNFSNYHTCQVTQKLQVEKSPVSIAEYTASFNAVQNYLKRGDSYLVNLTKPTELNANVGIGEIFYTCNARYLLNFKNQFIVFSPERFLRIYDSCVESNPMKGTIDASLPDAKQKIIDNAKEAAEHATIVDLIRNDISRFSHNVRVDKYRYVEKLKTNNTNLLQVSSKITGQLMPQFKGRLGDIFSLCLPAGSVTGAPKHKTLQIIEEVEGYSRGFYTGVFGWFDGKNVDSAVMIRYIENYNGKLVFKSGGGITAQSICCEEYEELIQKVYVPINRNHTVHQ